MKINNCEKEKTLILTQTDPDKDTMFNSWIQSGLKADIIFKNVSKPLRFVRRIVANYLPYLFISPWLGDWKEKLGQYNTIILHASELTSRIPQYIHSVNPKIRIIYWYWNPVNEKSKPSRLTDKNVELWTFNRRDQYKYNMNYNVQYYSGPMQTSQNNDIKYDVYFIGHDKGRKDYINKVKKLMESQNIKCKFSIIPDNSKKFVPYNTVKRNLLSSKAVLEVNQDGQDGYTLRALESLFLKRKLITNNTSLKKANFFCEDNIYILCQNINPIGIKKFIDSPYNHKVDSFLHEYTIDSWFNNFFLERK